MDYYVCGLVIGITKGTESLKRFRPEVVETLLAYGLSLILLQSLKSFMKSIHQYMKYD